MIPFLDLKRAYAEIKDEITEAVSELMDSQQFILGEVVERFEQDFARECTTKYAIGVASCSDALVLALRALNIHEGDEVITTPFTFIATAEAIVRVGAKPVFVDIEPDTYNLDPNRIAAAITYQTRAVFPVYLYGQCADMQRIKQIVGEIPIIEDAAQAFGATHNNLPAGSMGIIGCHSFFPTKNLGGFGDGGMVTTNDASLDAAIRALRAHGASRRYCHDRLGMNSRLDAIQACVLGVKMKRVFVWIRQRILNAMCYNHLLADLPVITPFADAKNQHTYNQYTIRVTDRPALIKAFKQREIGHAIYYQQPLHLQPCFDYLGYKKGDFPIAETASEQVLSLPIYPGLTDTEQEQIAEVIQQTLQL